MILNKGDIALLIASNRIFEVIDERRVVVQRDNCEQEEYEELCKFDDNPRNPIWIFHNDIRDHCRHLTLQEAAKRSRRNE